MKPEEKAKELYDKFDNLYCTTCEEYPELEVCNLCHHQVKQCALICVDEIIFHTIKYQEHLVSEIRRESYWQEVKQEIEKL